MFVIDVAEETSYPENQEYFQLNKTSSDLIFPLQNCPMANPHMRISYSL